MNPPVLYLSHYPPSMGFLFPNELPKQYYAPGLFVVEQNPDGRLPYQFDFDAMDRGNRITLHLVRQNEGDLFSNLYIVRTKFLGTFGFRITGINPLFERYRGNHPALLNHRKLHLLVSQDSRKLERVCEKYDFYFIGDTLSHQYDG